MNAWPPKKQNVTAPASNPPILMPLIPLSPAAFESQVDILARTLYGEARGEGLAGIEAVACVILNRTIFAQKRGKYWWGNDVGEVCKKAWQFSCWNQNDPNREKLEKVGVDDPAFAMCVRVARRAMSGALTDKVLGATHYHHVAVHPKWAECQVPVKEIGHHVFYSNLE